MPAYVTAGIKLIDWLLRNSEVNTKKTTFRDYSQEIPIFFLLFISDGIDSFVN